jgi:hypothetical protein
MAFVGVRGCKAAALATSVDTRAISVFFLRRCMWSLSVLQEREGVRAACVVTASGK